MSVLYHYHTTLIIIVCYNFVGIETSDYLREKYIIIIIIIPTGL